MLTKIGVSEVVKEAEERMYHYCYDVSFRSAIRNGECFQSWKH